MRVAQGVAPAEEETRTRDRVSGFWAPQEFNGSTLLLSTAPWDPTPGIISVGPSGDVTGEPDIRWISAWISVVADSLNLAAHTNKADIANTK